MLLVQYLLNSWILSAPGDGNDALAVISTLETFEETAILFRFQVNDIDISSSLMVAKLTVTNGFISLNRAAGLRGKPNDIAMDPVLKDYIYLSGRSLDDDPIAGPNGNTDSITGDLCDINAQLSTLKYQSPKNAYGYDYIHITVWDNGYTGEVFYNASQEVAIVVDILPVNDPPIMEVSGTEHGVLYDDNATWEVGVFTMKEDSSLELGKKVSIEDVDFDPNNILGERNFENVITDNVFELDMIAISFTAKRGMFRLQEVGHLMFFSSEVAFKTSVLQRR